MIRAVFMLVVVVIGSAALGIPALTVGRAIPAHRSFDRLFHWWSRLLLWAAGVRLNVQNPHAVDPAASVFLVGNHQSALDIPVLTAVARGHVRFMAKQSLFRIPVMGWCMSTYGFASIDRSNARQAARSIDAMLSRLREQPASFLVFPEGTRSADGTIKPFKQGAMNVCRRADRPVVPFAIAGTVHVHRRGVFRIRPGAVHLRLGKPMPPEVLRSLSTRELATIMHDQVAAMHRDLATAGGNTPAPSVASVEG